jgi:hypothetical protein
MEGCPDATKDPVEFKMARAFQKAGRYDEAFRAYRDYGQSPQPSDLRTDNSDQKLYAVMSAADCASAAAYHIPSLDQRKQSWSYAKEVYQKYYDCWHGRDEYNYKASVLRIADMFAELGMWDSAALMYKQGLALPASGSHNLDEAISLERSNYAKVLWRSNHWLEALMQLHSNDEITH